jgi:DNA-binding response OmpR family regulator
MSKDANFAHTSPPVALVEDEQVLRDEMVFQLRHRGLNVLGFADATGLYRHMATGSLAVVVLDIGLPGEDGYSIAKLLREHNRQMGIVFLTARSMRDDKLAGLALGADAYLTKPVDLDELELLLRRLLDRQPAPAAASNSDAVGAAGANTASTGKAAEELWKLNTLKGVLIAPDGSRVSLTMTELQLLGELVAKRGKPCKHTDVARALGLQPDQWDRHRLEVIVSRLRAKVERETGFGAPVRTVRGVGYAWEAERVG